MPPGATSEDSVCEIASWRFGSKGWPSAAIGVTSSRSNAVANWRRTSRNPSIMPLWRFASSDSPSSAGCPAAACSIARSRLSSTGNISLSTLLLVSNLASSTSRRARLRTFSTSAEARKYLSQLSRFSFSSWLSFC